MHYIIIILLLLSTLSSKNLNYQELSVKFQDKNHDLLADIPKDPKKWLDPYTLVFAYTPNEAPSIYRDIWKDFIIYLEKITGKNVVFFPFQTNTAQLEAMRSGKLHIAGFNTGTVPLAVNSAGFHPIAVMGNSDSSFGYQMEIITFANSNIKRIEDIKNETLVLTSPSSNSGSKTPLSLLKNNYGLSPEKDFKIKYSGRHSNSILGIVKKQYKVAAIASSVRKRMIKRGEIRKEDIRIIYQSETFPTTGYGYVYNLKPALAKKVEEAFLTFQWIKKDGQATSLKKGFYTHDKFISIDYKKTWKKVRERILNHDINK